MREKPLGNEKKPSQYRGLKPAWKPGEAPKSPGRPPLSTDVKAERRLMRQGLNDATPEAIQLLRHALGSKDERNAIRSAEIILSHTMPKLEEVNIHDNRPQLADWSPDILKQLAGEAAGAPETNGHSGNGVAA